MVVDWSIIPDKEAAHGRARHCRRAFQHQGTDQGRPGGRRAPPDAGKGVPPYGHPGRVAGRGCGGGCLIGNLSQELADQSECFGAQLEAVLTDWRERYARLFREAQAVGELREDLDPQQLAEFYLNSFEGAVLRAKVSKSPAPLRLFMTLMFDGVLRGNPAAR